MSGGLLLAAGCGLGHVRASPARERHASSSSVAPRAAAAAGRALSVSFWSPALHRRRSYVVYLPAGYAATAARGIHLPVLYLLHSAVGRPWGMIRDEHVERVLQGEIDAHRARPMLLVFPDGRIPGVSSDSEFANIRYGRYMDTVVDTVHAVDHRFSTIPDRSGRAFGGVSTGGYAAANICLHHLALCGGFESWGGYFVQTRDFPFDREPEANRRANSPVEYVAGLRGPLHRRSTWAFAYQGSSDPTESDLRLFMRRFDAAGGHGRAAVIPGGHGWGLWRRELPAMFRLASQHLR